MVPQAYNTLDSPRRQVHLSPCPPETQPGAMGNPDLLRLPGPTSEEYEAVIGCLEIPNPSLWDSSVCCGYIPPMGKEKRYLMKV